MPNTLDPGQGQTPIPPPTPYPLLPGKPVHSTESSKRAQKPTPNNSAAQGSQTGTPVAPTGPSSQTPGPQGSSHPQNRGQQRTSGPQQPQSQQTPEVQRSSQGSVSSPQRSSWLSQISQSVSQTMNGLVDRVDRIIPGGPPRQNALRHPSTGQQPRVPQRNQVPPQPSQRHTQPHTHSGANLQPQYPTQSSTPPSSPTFNQSRNYSPPRQPSAQPPPASQNQIQAHNRGPSQYQSEPQRDGLIRQSGKSQPAPGLPSSLHAKQPATPPASTSQSSSAQQSQSVPPPVRASTANPQQSTSSVSKVEPQQLPLPSASGTQEQIESHLHDQPHTEADHEDATASIKRKKIPSLRLPLEVAISVTLIVLLLAVFFLTKTPIADKVLAAGSGILSTVVFVLIAALLGFLGGLRWHALGESRQIPEDTEQVQGLQKQLAETEEQLHVTQRERDQLLMEIRNTPSPKQESSQVQQQTQGNETKVPSQALPHLSVYDRDEDPPDYDKATTQHPHHKLYPGRVEEESRLGYNWRIIGASRRGYGHAYLGKYREDDFAIRIFPGLSGKTPHVALVAIADGVSAKPSSRYGALAAVQGATDFSSHPTPYKPENAIHPLVRMLREDAPREQYEEQAFNILHASLYAAMLSVQKRAESATLTVNDLQSTLMVFLVVPLGQRRLFVASTQIGDGILLSLKDNGGPRLRDRWGWLQFAQIQSSGNEVQPFMRSDPEGWRSFFKCEVLEDVIFAMGMTDGTADDIEPPRATTENPDPDPFTYVESFYQLIKKDVLASSQPAQALNEFLRYKKVQSHDDRTVICLYNEKAQ
jgi:Protein phosphatase 2C